MQREPKPNLPPGTDVEGMAVVELLGVGGYGAVYRAQLPSGRECALKFIPYSTSLERALREFFILLQLRHRNLVRVSALGVWPEDKPEFLWLKMEFIEGERLDTWARARALTARTAARLTLEVCRGLAFAHGLKVVHRDVKEANILVRESDGQAVLIDFGLGTYEDALTLTSGPVPAGTSGYQAPELLRHAHAFDNQEVTDKYTSGPGDDLYALGVVLYRLLTGKAPVDGENELAVINEEPLPVLVVNPVIPRELAGVCMRLLQKSPGSRYESAAALCSVLEDLLLRAGPEWDVPLLGVAPTSAPPTSRSSARRRTLERPRRQLGAVAAGVVTLLAAVSWVSVAGLPGQNVPVAPPERAANPEVPVTSHGPNTTPPDGKLAPSYESPDAGHRAGSTTVETSPASGAPPAPPQVMPTMKTKQAAPSVVPARESNLVRTILCTGALFVAGGCAGGPSMTRPPRKLACPRASLESMRALRIMPGDEWNGVLQGFRGAEYTRLTDGDRVVGMTDDPIGKLPERTLFTGRAIFGGLEGEPFAYLYFDKAIPPGSTQSVDVCFCLAQPLTPEGSMSSSMASPRAFASFPEGCDRGRPPPP